MWCVCAVNAGQPWGWLVGDARFPGQAVVVPCHQSLRLPARSPQAALIAALASSPIEELYWRLQRQGNDGHGSEMWKSIIGSLYPPISLPPPYNECDGGLT